MKKKKVKQIQNLLFEPELLKGKDNYVIGADNCIYQYEKYPFFSQWKKDFSNIILNAGWKSKRSKLKWSVKRKGKVVFFRIEVTQFKNDIDERYNQLLPTPTCVEAANPTKVLENKEKGLSLKSREAGHNIQSNLQNWAIIGMLPTPTTIDAVNNGDMTAAAKIMNGAAYRSSGERIQKTLTHAIHQEILEGDLELAESLAKKEMVKRINLPKQEEFVEWIRSKTNPKSLSELTGIKLSKVEHWFRKDNSGFSYPSIEEWQVVSELLEAPTELDKKMTHTISIEWSGMLPTPTSFDLNSARTEAKWVEDQEKWSEKGVSLKMPLKQLASFDMLPTPVSGEYRDTGDNVRTSEFKQMNLTRTIAKDNPNWSGKSTMLSPLFVAEMMGFPPNWLVLPYIKNPQ